MRKFLFILGLFFSLNQADAASITCQVSGYIGRYHINSGAANVGDKVLSLNPGNYTFGISNGGSTGFTVNGDGTVTSSNTAILSASGSTLTLNTVPIYFNIGSYNNVYSISGSAFQLFSGTFNLPVNLAVSLDVPSSNTVASLVSDANGVVNVTSGTEKLSTSSGNVSFNTITVKVNPGPFNGTYAFLGKGFLAGSTSHNLFPNTSYRLITSTAAVIGNVQTNTTGWATNTTSYLKSESDTVYLYSNKYTVTPPSGYNAVWNIYGQGNSTGVDTKWLLLGMQSRLFTAGTTYYFTADSNCSSFNLSTSVGTFSFVCDPASSLIHNSLSITDFNDIESGYTLNKTDGRLSTNISDYSMSVNGTSHALTDYSLSNDTFTVYDAFAEGRNAIILDGEDSSSNIFQINPVFWAGSAEIQVETSGPTDTITLDVEQVIGSNTYTTSVSKAAVNHLAVFKNVPRLSFGFVHVSSSRGNTKMFRTKISDVELVSFK